MAKFIYTGQEYLNADHIISIDIVIGIKILSTMLSFYLENVLREQSSVVVL